MFFLTLAYISRICYNIGMKKKYLFIQDTGHFDGSFVVTHGYDKEEVLKFIKKTYAKEYMGKAKELLDLHFEDNEHFQAFVIHCDDKPYFLKIVNSEDTWDFWETLIHEVTHVVDFTMRRHGCESELENRAYLTQYLFRNIRRKIQGTIKI
jgi:hypothetical protein